MQERDKNWEPESHTINDGRGGGGGQMRVHIRSDAQARGAT